MFNNRKRIDAAFAKGLMFGKAVGARDERDRIINLLIETPQGADVMMQAVEGDDDGESIVALINGNYEWCYCVGTWRCPNHAERKLND